MQPLAIARPYKLAMTFKTGQVTSYAAGDDGDLEIGLDHDYVILTTGQYAGSTNIVLGTVPKTDVHNNACVYDRRSRLMWSQTVSASVGPASNGLLPWTVNANGEGIFQYAAAANLALLAGYGDDPDPKKNWRVPNRKELESIMDENNSGCIPNIIAFPVWPIQNYWTSTTMKAAITNARYISFATGQTLNGAKTSAVLCILVRGPL